MLRFITSREIEVDFVSDGRRGLVGKTMQGFLFADDLFCYECDKTFKAVSSYRRHMRDYHGDSNTQVVLKCTNNKRKPSKPFCISAPVRVL